MEFIVNGKPQGKARPRFSRKSGTVYTPNKTARYEREIRKAFLAAGGKLIPSDCYVNVSVDAYFAIPKSYSKRKHQECLDFRRPTNKPDVDNILKAVLDALNKVAYEDDKQVVAASCRKYYTENGDYIKIDVIESKM